MNKAKTHIYFIPGMAAGREIFSAISLPKDDYVVHVVEWMVPEKNETLINYAHKMSLNVIEPNSVLIGVSFGGVVAQEMSIFLDLKKLIIISSIKSKFEMPQSMLFTAKTKAYKLIPTGMFSRESTLLKFAIGAKANKKLSLYYKYLTMRDKTYLNWAIYQMFCWNRIEQVEDVIHIHGDQDIVFPIENIKDCIVLPGGTHIMIINKFRWLNKNLPKIIEGNFLIKKNRENFN